MRATGPHDCCRLQFLQLFFTYTPAGLRERERSVTGPWRGVSYSPRSIADVGRRPQLGHRRCRPQAAVSVTMFREARSSALRVRVRGFKIIFILISEGRHLVTALF